MIIIDTIGVIVIVNVFCYMIDRFIFDIHRGALNKKYVPHEFIETDINLTEEEFDKWLKNIFSKEV